MTAEEFYRLPDPPEGGKLQLLCGKVVREMPAGGKHGKRQAQISHAMMAFLQERAEVTVETGFMLRHAPDVVLAPDAAVIPRERLPNGELPDGFVEGPPSLAVEVVSPHDTEAELMQKVGYYLDAGVDRVWLVRSRNRSVTVFYLSGEIEQVGVDGVLTSAHAGFAEDGFSLPVATLFA